MTQKDIGAVTSNQNMGSEIQPLPPPPKEKTSVCKYKTPRDISLPAGLIFLSILSSGMKSSYCFYHKVFIKIIKLCA